MNIAIGVITLLILGFITAGIKHAYKNAAGGENLDEILSNYGLGSFFYRVQCFIGKVFFGILLFVMYVIDIGAIIVMLSLLGGTK